MLSRTAFINGRQFLNFTNFPGNNSARLQLRRRCTPISKVQSIDDSLTSTGLIDDDLENKIIYNEVIHKKKILLKQKCQQERLEFLQKCKDTGRPPMTAALFMKCMADNNDKPTEDNLKTESDEAHFPFQFARNVLTNDNVSEQFTDNDNEQLKVNDNANAEKLFHDMKLQKSGKKVVFEDPVRWMPTVNEDNAEILIEDGRFGSYDPKIPISEVPCGGCGALLHCTNMTIPGFIPVENFKGYSAAELRGKICQRCLFLKEYNVALGVTVNVDEYPKIIAELKKKRVLVLLLIDLLDFPCSIWPNILDVVGKDKSLFVIGNKIDLLIDDGEEFLQHRKKCMMDAVEDFGITEGNVKHVELISAKTGFGIEKLITAIQSKWGDKGDIYIVGCTNAGKSTLFNTLIQSDMCKSKAADILQRATVSHWPGTTLNLLKFPMIRPLSWRIAVRTQRLRVEKKKEDALRQVKQDALKTLKGKRYQCTLMGYVGRTFPAEENTKRQIGLDPDDCNFKFGKWCYDTPGVVYEAQILNLLTTSELSKVLPLKAIVPRNFKLEAGHTLFIGGLARLDFVEGKQRVWFTVYASPSLPLTITSVQDADLVYQKLLGTDEFVVPHGNKERMEKWPPLMSRDFKIYGKYKDVGGGDIVLSSAGWVSVAPSPASSCDLRAWTPAGRGIFLRRSNLIRNGVKFKGDRIPGTPAYETSIEILENFKLKHF